MYRHLLFGLAIVLCLTQPIASPLAEDQTAWVVAESSGRVIVSSGIVDRVSLRQGDQIAPGSRIRTLENGRAILTRGEDVIIMSPNSEVAVPTSQPAFGTRLLQNIGRAIYKVTRRPSPHFEVDTPYLAATVKGTTFEVTSSPSESAVHVVDGRVQVSDLRGGRSAVVGAGETARVDATRGLSLQVGPPPMTSGGNGNGDGKGNGGGGGKAGGGEP